MRSLLINAIFFILLSLSCFGQKINSNRINLEGFNTPCIYILYKEDEMVYIGETTSFSKRLAQHITEGKKCFDSFKLRYFIDNDKVRKNKEKRMIKKFKPKYNIIHNKTNK